MFIKMEKHEELKTTVADLFHGEAPSNLDKSFIPLSAQSSSEGMSPGITGAVQQGGQLSPRDPVTQPVKADVPVQFVPETEGWIAEINLAFVCQTGWVFETGDRLLQANAELPHGQWMSMFESRKLKFGLRTGEMLMAVARHPTLRNSKYFSSLPSAWSILYVLSRLPAEFVEQGVLSGVIHPELKLAEARRLLRSARAGGPAAPNPPAPPPFDLDRQKNRVCDYLRGQLKHWPLAYLEELAALLETLAAVLREE
jgi:hypothetical protein